jgi:mRNA interferase RelE/StbE
MITELERIAADPTNYPGDWRKLTGSAYWRLRVGRYRAICNLRDDELVLLVIKAGPRGDIYK